MANIPIGLKHEEKLLVTGDVAIDFLGQEGARVLATPRMIGQMEMTCRNAVFPYLDPGHDTVGTQVNVKHLAATPMGMTVTFRAEVIEVDDRRVTFRVEAWDEKDKAGRGHAPARYHQCGQVHREGAGEGAGITRPGPIRAWSSPENPTWANQPCRLLPAPTPRSFAGRPDRGRALTQELHFRIDRNMLLECPNARNVRRLQRRA